MKLSEALAQLPTDAYLSCTFGFEGEGGYSEFHHTPDGRRFEIQNGPYYARKPFVWSIREHSAVTVAGKNARGGV